MLDVAAVGIDPRDAGHVAHLGSDDPVLHRAQIRGLRQFGGQPFAFWRQIAAIGLPARLAVDDLEALAIRVPEGDRVEEDLAQPRAQRRQVWLDARRQAVLRLRETLRDLLSREIDVGRIGEHRRDLAEPVASKRPGQRQPGNAGKRGFDGECDLLFHVDGAKRRIEGVDLHLTIGDVGHGVDR